MTPDAAAPIVDVVELAFTDAAPTHRHAAAHACVVIAGAFEDAAQPNGRRRLSAGVARFDAPGAAHRVHADSDGAICVVAEWRGATTSSFGERLEPVPRLAEVCAAALQRARRVDTPASDWLARREMAATFDAAARRGDAAEPEAWLIEARRAFDADAASARVGDVARDAGVHRATLAQAFRRAWGVSPQDYRTLKRLERAGELLRAGANGAAAASGSGFADQPQLVRAWRGAFGATPGRWATIVQDAAAGA